MVKQDTIGSEGSRQGITSCPSERQKELASQEAVVSIDNFGQFFNNLRKVITREKLGPEAVWNIAATGLTIAHKLGKIVAVRGEKQVGKVTSNESGELVPVCCSINAISGYIPQFMLFPCVNWQDRMLQGAPRGTAGAANSSGWMTAENFVQFLKHFVKSSTYSKALIIMDNHDSHISLESLKFAKENSVILLTIPTHASHKLQPLYRSVFAH